MFWTLQPTAYAVSFLFFALALITTAIRFYSRKCIIKSFGWGDWWMMGVFKTSSTSASESRSVCFYIMEVGCLSAISNHLTAEYLLFTEEILYVWMQFVIKHGFLQFYLRLADQTSFTYSIYAAMVLNLLIAIALWLLYCLYCLQCRPLPASWNAAAYPDATCLDTAVTYYVPVSFNIFTDFIIVALPIRTLWYLQASLSRRLGVIAVVSARGVAAVVSCLRVIVLHEFCMTELDVAITTANAPSLKAVWLKHVSGTLSSYISSIRLSSPSKKKKAAAPEPCVIRHRAVPKHDSDLPDSSSTNNLARHESYAI
ncbi:uncharacterized protein BDV17DRAFT_294646 [Aspergillus undulatus]|uniref:uncharacterized protein n=1 Tax=Aspergillus undulatus TaxID=1810928 RepID=UPI003CCDE53B